MELTRTGLKDLLENDAIFSDYLNTFLNLPGFYLRVTYLNKNKSYTVDPPVQTDYYVLHPDDITAWIHKCRFPHFLRSSLFYEYKLCVALNETSKVLMNRPLLSTVSAMYDFKKFLFQTEGEVAFYFWLDVERLKLSSQSSIWNRKLIIEIFETYISERSSFSLKTPLRENLLKLYTQKVGKAQIPWNTRQIRNQLTLCQKEVLDRLSDYWCYGFAHSCGKAVFLKATDTITTDQTTKHPMPEKREFHLPSIILSRGDCKFSTKESTIYCHQSIPPYVPEESHRLRYLSHKVSHSSFAKATLVPSSPTGLLPPSTESLLNESSVIPLLSLLRKSLNDGPLNLDPFLSASLRADFAAGNHFLRYLKKTQLNLLNANYLLFWQSIELLGIKDEVKCWYNMRYYKNKKISDGCANPTCPYIYYYEPHLIARDLKELCSLFLSPDALHRIWLPREMMETLEKLVQRGLGQSLALDAQKYVAQQLLAPWLKYLMHDLNDFKNTYLTRKYQRRFPITLERRDSKSELEDGNQLAENSYGSEYLQVMWDALKYVETIKYAGIHQLPSRKATERSSSKPVVKSELNVPSVSILDEAEQIIEEHSLDRAGVLTTIDDKLLWDMTKGRYKRILTISTKTANMPTFVETAHLNMPLFITDVLQNSRHLEAFKEFLVRNGPDGVSNMLDFYLAVEEWKALSGKHQKYELKFEEILEKFVRGSAVEMRRAKMTGDTPPKIDPGYLQEPADLKCDAPEIQALDEAFKPDHRAVVRAQAAVRDILHKEWFDLYVQYLAEVKKKRIRHRAPRESAGQHWNAEKSKAAWTSFIRSLVSFKQGLVNPVTMSSFRRFIMNEIEDERQYQGTMNPRKLLGTKVITITKLFNDLDFWIEVIRYKNLMTNIKSASQGPYNPEDFITVHKKAQAIVSCYLDSVTSPRIQVNAASEVVRDIMDKLSRGNIGLDLFHKAVLDVFSGLIYYWRKFTAERIIRSRGYKHHSSKRTTSVPNVKSSKRTAKRPNKCSQHTFAEYGPIMSFSLYHGLRWLFPSYIIIYIPHSCWELEAVGVELPKETAMEHRLRLNNRHTLLIGNKTSSAASLDNISLASSRGALFRQNSALLRRLGKDILPPIKVSHQKTEKSVHRHSVSSHPPPTTPSLDKSEVEDKVRRHSKGD